MTGFRILLGALFMGVVAYTIPVVMAHGFGLLPVFFGDIAEMGWPGQFNLDFLGFLVLSGLWMAWRHRFSPGGIGLGLLGFFGGVPVLSIYLIIVSYREDGHIAAILLGSSRASLRP